jgi:hypothetical protein
MFIILRRDTPNYAWVKSIHKTLDSADARWTALAKGLGRDVQVSEIYSVHETRNKFKKGQRIRYSDI